jgi:hypothetical protein
MKSPCERCAFRAYAERKPTSILAALIQLTNRHEPCSNPDAGRLVLKAEFTARELGR